MKWLKIIDAFYKGHTCNIRQLCMHQLVIQKNVIRTAYENQTYLKPQNCVLNAHSGFSRPCVMKCSCMSIEPRCQIRKSKSCTEEEVTEKYMKWQCCI